MLTGAFHGTALKAQTPSYPFLMYGRYFQYGTKQEIAEFVRARRIT